MARQTEKVIQTRIGKRTVELDKVLYFPRGIIGFEDHHEFVLLQLKDDSPFLMLQSMSDARVGLLVADPYSFTSDYEIKLGEPEQKLLRLKNIRQVAVLVTVTIPQGEPEKTALNLMGPILVNYASRIGLQVPQVDSRYPSHLYLHEPNE
jgi:flagellar assembly factor FliW